MTTISGAGGVVRATTAQGDCEQGRDHQQPTLDSLGVAPRAREDDEVDGQAQQVGEDHALGGIGDEDEEGRTTRAKPIPVIRCVSAAVRTPSGRRTSCTVMVRELCRSQPQG